MTRPAAGQMTGAPEDTHLLDYVRALYKRRWVAAGVWLLVMGIGAYSSLTATPQYEARLQLLIETERPDVVVFDDAETGRDAALDYRETQYGILQSRTLAARSLERLALWQHPLFGGENGPAQESVIQRLGGSLRSTVTALNDRFSRSSNYTQGVYLVPEVVDVDREFNWEETEDQIRAIDRFTQRLEVTPVGGSRLVDVKFRSPEPRLAAAVLNTLVDEYMTQNLEFKTLVSEESAAWLGEQLDEHRAQVRESQLELQRFREEASAEGPVDAGGLVQRQVEELNAALMRARTERIQREALAQRVEAADGDGTQLTLVPEVAADPRVQALRKELADLRAQDRQLSQRFGERHPERAAVRVSIQSAEERLAAQMSRIVGLIQQSYLAALDEEGTLAAAVEGQRREALGARGRQIEYEALERAAVSDRQVFETLLLRAKEIGVTTGMVASNIRVVDAASVPVVPVSPNHRVDLLLSLMVALFSGAGMAFFVDYMDRSIDSPDDITRELGLNCLALVPVTPGLGEGATRVDVDAAPHVFQEALRVVRTKVLFSIGKGSTRSLLVTSTSPNEGKTLIASQLATVIAQTGQRVVLVDADLRRPSVHTFFGTAQAPGLSEVATGVMKPSLAIGESPVQGLWLLPSGEIPENPSELISSESVKKLVGELGRTFDWVIIDSPPVMAVTDATILSDLVSAVLFVVAADKSKAPAALKAIEQLEVAQASFVGVVLNKVKLGRHAFYYSDYYRRDYGRYYGSPQHPFDGGTRLSRVGRRVKAVFSRDKPSSVLDRSEKRPGNDAGPGAQA